MKWQSHPSAGARMPAKPGKPRNPHVAASRFRKAGAHGRTQGGARAQALRELRDQVKDLGSRDP